jgi:excisionase family DNA binding protein
MQWNLLVAGAMAVTLVNANIVCTGTSMEFMWYLPILRREVSMVVQTGKPLVSVAEAAELLHISKWTVYHWVDKGWLVSIRLPSRQLRIAQSSIDKALSGKTYAEMEK